MVSTTGVVTYSNIVIVRFGKQVQGITDVYPNPTTGRLVIDMNDLKGESFALHNALGQLVLTDQIQDEITLLNLKNYSSGIYFLTIKAEEGIINMKVLVE